MKVTVYGAGYVGLVTAVCLAEIGHAVVCMDVDKYKIDNLKKGVLPIYEEGLEAILHANVNHSRIQFTTSVEEAVSFGDIQMIAVGTPSREDGTVNVDFIDAVAHSIGQHRVQPCVVVNKSTVPPGTASRVHQIIEQAATQLSRSNPATMVSNPEFLQEGTAVKQCMNPDRILIGTDSTKAAEIMKKLYEPLCVDHPERMIVMSTRSAELSKYAANAFLATKISFINEISQIAERVGADVHEVRQGIVSDYRINPAFLNPGCGFGGSCFPKDLAGLEQIALEYEFSPLLISAVIKRNQEQQKLLFNKINAFFSQNLTEKVIALWGLAFKPNTDDIRCASSQVIIDGLLNAGAIIQAYDPLAMQAVAARYTNHQEQLHFADSAMNAAANADALVVVTEWPEFQAIQLSDIRAVLKQPVLFDGRNCFDPKHAVAEGFYYSGIGRAPIESK